MPRTAQSFPTTGSLEGSRMSYSAPFQRQLASRTTTRGIAVITVAISSLLCSAFLAERIRGPGNRHLILFISAGTCRGHTNVRLCGRNWRMILFHRHARGSDSPSFAVVAMLPTKSSLDDSRCDAAAVSPLSMSIVVARIVSYRICPSIATRVASYPATRWRTQRNRPFRTHSAFGSPRTHAPAFIKRPPPPRLPLRRHNRQIPEAAGHPRIAISYDFRKMPRERVTASISRRSAKSTDVGVETHRLSAEAGITYIPGDSHWIL